MRTAVENWIIFIFRYFFVVLRSILTASSRKVVRREKIARNHGHNTYSDVLEYFSEHLKQSHFHNSLANSLMFTLSVSVHFRDFLTIFLKLMNTALTDRKAIMLSSLR